MNEPLLDPQFAGQAFNWWIGQIADDSFWRDNINAGKFKSKKSIRGWGYRYKVRIFGLHDWGEGSIESKNLPWANVMYPITAGAYLQGSGQTPMLRQGNIVFGFFMDGAIEGQQPVIMGVLGNQTQTPLKTTIGDSEVTNDSGGTVGVSGYAKGQIDHAGLTEAIPNDGDKGVEKPKTEEQAQESATPAPGVSLNIYGLPSNLPLTKNQLADIASAREEINLILSTNTNFSLSEQQQLIRDRVASGVTARTSEANSSRSPVQPGATWEGEGVHGQTAATIKLDEIFCKKRVLLKPDNIVESCNRAMQTDMDNMVQDIDKALNALSSYTDAVSMTRGVKNLKKVISNNSKSQSKYMKIIMDKVMEYSQKSLNKEMTNAVSAIPSCKRWQMADLKDGMTQNMLSSFNDITGGMGGLMEGIITKMLNLDGPEGLIAKAQQIASTGTGSSSGKPKAIPKVPICNSEDVIATVLSASKGKINETNQNILDNMDSFVTDCMSDLAGVSGSITSVFSAMKDMKGNMTSALNFENIKMNVFPFELPPNPAVSDYYTFCSGGASSAQDQLPSFDAITAATNKVRDEIIPKVVEQFAEPTAATLDVFFDDSITT